jgi:hypothetical protein
MNHMNLVYNILVIVSIKWKGTRLGIARPAASLGRRLGIARPAASLGRNLGIARPAASLGRLGAPTRSGLSRGRILLIGEDGILGGARSGSGFISGMEFGGLVLARFRLIVTLEEILSGSKQFLTFERWFLTTLMAVCGIEDWKKFFAGSCKPSERTEAG